ncbi:NAC domain [Trypanosoma vivax]|uniref:Putative nascent polypeptide associated complex subunit n=1 Tax=Trypanosoma vivax (strain Y486) TaxID=1055687 RepID=G0U2J7_TRYVY|nr:NAC domain [Trypanosoma vivax]CCC50500.1 putative nascent polypeptide associated complex subunit [Trypanosoma vivax Y486]
MTAESVQDPHVEDDDVPTLEAADVPQVSKSSKRCAKAMAKMGLKPEPNIVKAHIRKNGSLSFLVNHPEVYRFPGTNTFIIFGEAQLGDAKTEAQEAAARAVSGVVSDVTDTVGTTSGSEGKVDDSARVVEPSDDEIKSVMTGAHVDRHTAVQALKDNDGDVVNAIMKLHEGKK